MIRCYETQQEPYCSLQDHQTSSSQAFHQCIASLVGHTSSYISSITLAGKRLYTGSNDGVVRLWNTSTMETLTEESSSGDVITGERGGGAVKSLLILGDKLFTAHQDQKIRVWKINDVVEEVSSKKYMHLATMPTMSDRFAKSLMPKDQVEIRRHKKASWVHHVDAVSGLALSRDGTLLYSVSWDRTLKIWRTTDFKCLQSITNAHDDAINAVELSENGDIYTGSSDRRIKVWRKKNNDEEKNKKNKKHSLVSTLSEHNSGINALALSSYKSSLLHSGGSDGSILVWQRDNESNDISVVGVLRGHVESVLCLKVVWDILCSGSADKTVRVWKCSATDFSCLAMLEGHRGPVKCLTGLIRDSGKPSEASYQIYSGGIDSQVKVWQILVPAL